jgi:hypothetical protein
VNNVPPQNDPTVTLPFSFAATTTTYASRADIPATKNTALAATVRAHVEQRLNVFAEDYSPSKFTPEEMEELGIGSRYLYEQIITGTAWEFGVLDGMHVEEYEFTGGAHGGTSITPFMFDESGKQLVLKDLFIPDSTYLETIADLARPRLKARLEENGMYADDMFTPGTEPTEENYAVFSLSDAGITFTFGQYQVAPYAAGMQEVTIPFAELNDILSKEYF